jgi:hypothetical protein
MFMGLTLLGQTEMYSPEPNSTAVEVAVEKLKMCKPPASDKIPYGR